MLTLSLDENVAILESNSSFHDNPKIVSDIVLSKDVFLKKEKYFLVSEEREKYLKLNKEQFDFYNIILPYFDGTHSSTEIEKVLFDISGDKILLKSVMATFSKYNLLFKRKEENKNKVELELSSKKVLNIDLNTIQKKHKLLFHILFYIIFLLSLSSTIYGIMLILFNIDTLMEVYRESKVFTWSNIKIWDLALITVLAYLSLIIHELGHLLKAHNVGLEWKTLNVSLHWGISPIFYIKYYNFYTFASAKKIKVLFWGIYNNIAQVFFYFIVMYYTQDWRFAVIMFINFGMIISCVNPTGTSDGYHIISIILGIEGIRWKMLKVISTIVNKTNKIRIVLSNKTNLLLILYFIVSYTITIFGCYTLLITIIDFLDILHISSKMLIITMALWVFTSVTVFGFRFYKNLKEL